MPRLSRLVIFGKLNNFLYKALEDAAVYCKLNTNPDVRLQHWLIQILKNPTCDIRLQLKSTNTSPDEILMEVQRSIDSLPKGATSPSNIDGEIDAAIERAWIYATLAFHETTIRSGHVLIAILNSETSRRTIAAISPLLASIDPDRAIDSFEADTLRSAEHGSSPSDGSSGPAYNGHGKKGIFISYRRLEARHVAGRIYDHLERYFGHNRVFKDVNTIPIGSPDFPKEIEKQLRSSKVLVAIIGQDWSEMRGDNNSRSIEDPNDHVRHEIEFALFNSVNVIPVLIDGADMPATSKLPVALRPLSLHQAISVRVDPDFQSDVRALIATCRRHLDADNSEA